MKYSKLIMHLQESNGINIKLVKRFILILVFVSVGKIYGQEVHSKITVLSGSSVPLSFNSYTKMINGIEYSNWTRLRILYFDTINDGSLTAASTWELLVRANSANIAGDGVVPMSLDKVELSVAAVTDDGTLNPIGGYLTLTNTDQPLVSNGANPTGRDIGATIGNNTEILISYRIGGNGGPPAINSILGEPPGYYFVDLIFTVQKE